MEGALQFVVAPGGGRVDRLVAQAAGLSRREARLRIGAGLVAVNGRPLRILTRPLVAGARVAVSPAPAVVPPSTALRILYIDRAVVAVDKPAGLLSEPDRLGAPALPQRLARQLAAAGEAPALWLVHRLDAGTSGVLLLARTQAAARVLHAAFAARRVHKRYLALCAGSLRGPQRIVAPLARLLGAGAVGYGGARGSRQGVVATGREAVTQVRALAHGAGACAIEALPETGRTHQIRVHLAHLGHPLLGDRLYGGPAYHGGAPVGRPMLHAAALELAHPRTGAPLRLRAAPAADLAALLAEMRAVERGGAPS